MGPAGNAAGSKAVNRPPTQSNMTPKELTMNNKPLTQREFFEEITTRLNADLEPDEDGNEVWSAQDVKTVLNTMLDVVVDELQDGTPVLIPGLVRLRLRYRKALPRRKGRAFGGEERTFAARPARIAVKAAPATALRREAPTATSAAGKAFAAEVAKKERARAAAAKKRAASSSTNGRKKATTRRKAA